MPILLDMIYNHSTHITKGLGFKTKSKSSKCRWTFLKIKYLKKQYNEIHVYPVWVQINFFW